MLWILLWSVAERSTPAASQSNSSCLEIDKNTKIVPKILKQYTYTKIVKNKPNFSRNPVIEIQK